MPGRGVRRALLPAAGSDTAFGPVDLAEARGALDAAAARSAALVASLPDLGARADRSEWTVAEAASHLAIGLRGFTAAATGDEDRWRPMIPDSPRYPERIAGLNRATISAEPDRSPATAGAAITAAVADYLKATAGRSPSEPIPTPWYGEATTHTVLSATCLLLGEQLVHGRDIARGVGHRWPITAPEARMAFEAVRAMMPIAIDRQAAGDLSTTFELHVGRGCSFQVGIHDGAATVDPPGPARVDCHIGGTPVALMLVGYGRISQWRGIASGRLITWGRKPWLGLRFVGLFFNS